MELSEIRRVVDEWANQITELGRQFEWVQVFENRGKIMGCSNPHPHCQVGHTPAMPPVDPTSFGVLLADMGFRIPAK